MLAQTAIQLKSGDTFSSNDGVDWHTVVDLYHLDEVVPKPVVLVTTDGYEKIWLWADEEIVVQI